MIPSAAVSTIAFEPHGGLAHGLLGVLSSGDVASDLGEASQLRVFVKDRCEHAAGEEPAAVLADVPALVGCAAGGGGGGDFLLGDSCGAILGGKEHRDLLADDVCFCITEELIGTRVPGDDTAVGIDGEDREILDALDHEPQAFFRLAKRLLDALAAGDLVLELAAAGFAFAGQDARFGEVALGAHLADHAAHDRLEVIEKVGSLGDEVAHSRAQRLDEQILVLKTGDQDGGHILAGLFDLAEEVQAGQAGIELLVQDDEINASRGHSFETRGRCSRRDHGVACALEL